MVKKWSRPKSKVKTHHGGGMDVFGALAFVKQDSYLIYLCRGGDTRR
jgi:hypothetical protein